MGMVQMKGFTLVVVWTVRAAGTYLVVGGTETTTEVAVIEDCDFE